MVVRLIGVGLGRTWFSVFSPVDGFHGGLVALEADLVLVHDLAHARGVLEVLVLVRPVLAELFHHAVGAVEELVEVLPLLQVHAPPGVAMDAA